jgi:UDP-glucose 4-epimerase
MGMTKALQERIFVAANVLASKTRFIAVRYGNVLASRGSVIPLFHDQILHQGEVTLTDPEMTRFLISLNQAVDMIFVALGEARRGEIYVPICPSGRMIDLAKALIGSRSVDIRVTGHRPGEKLHEVLISEEEIHHMHRRGHYYVVNPMLPELLPDRIPSMVLEKEYSSNDAVLSELELVSLLESHGLLLEQQGSGARGAELLR